MLFPVPHSAQSHAENNSELEKTDFMFTRPFTCFGAVFRFIELCFLHEYVHGARGHFGNASTGRPIYTRDIPYV